MEIRIDNLEPDFFYHIYNRGVNGENTFLNDRNCDFFLLKLKDYLLPVCDLYAFCILSNHFHLIVRIKSKEVIDKFFIKDKNFKKLKESGLHSYDSIVSKQFAKLISSYTQSFNKFDKKRTGALFESPFKRLRINSDEYLRNLIVYTHQNSAVFDANLENYQYSSYRIILSKGETLLKRKEVIEIFDDLGNFKFCHQKKIDI